MRNLCDLYNAEKNGRGLIVGTGPSLDAALECDWGDRPRILINHAARIFPVSPGRTYWIYLDDQEVYDPEWRRGIRDGITEVAPFFLMRRNGTRRFEPDSDAERVVQFHRVSPRSVPLDVENLALKAQLYSWCGTATTAAYLAHLLGFQTIQFVGVDGGMGRAASAQSVYRAENPEPDAYDRIRECAFSTLNALGYEGPKIPKRAGFPDCENSASKNLNLLGVFERK